MWTSALAASDADSQLNVTIAVAIITAIATLLSGLGATTLTLRHGRRIAADTLTENRRVDARRLIVALLQAARDWRPSAMLNTVVIANQTSWAMLDEYLAEFADTDSGKEMATNLAILRRTATEAALLVENSELRAAIEDLRVAVYEVDNQFHGQMFVEYKNGLQPSDAMLGAAMDHYKYIDNTLVQIERLTAELVKVRL